MISRRALGIVATATIAAITTAMSAGTAAVAQPSGWQKVSLPTRGHTIYGLRRIAFTDAQHGWIAGSLDMGRNKAVRDAVWLTSDAGRSWQLRWTPSSPSPGVTAFADAQHGWYATSSGRNATIYATADAGRTWAVQSTLPGDVVSLTAVDATHAWLAGNRGFLAATTDGSSWHRISSPTTNFAQSLQFRDHTDGWLADGTGRLYTTADGGRSWTRLTRVGRDAFGQIDFANLDRGWAGAYQGLYRSTNGGRTWTKQLSAAAGELGPIHFSDALHGWIVDGTSTMRTANGGQTWTDHAGPGRYLASITSTPGGDEWVVGLAAYRYANGA